MNNYQPLEIVGRGSETQLQVGENLKKSHRLRRWPSDNSLPTLELHYFSL